jgi:hypothetical protein
MKRLMLITFSMILSFVLVGGNQVAAHDEEAQKTNNVELTKAQQNELDALHKAAFEKHKLIINKYVEYGVFTKEKGDKIITNMEARLAELKANGYVPKWDHHRHKKDKSENAE